MTLPEPDTLCSTISDVVAVLSTEDRTNVLLYAMECLPMNVNSREVIETGVESFLQVSSKFRDREKSKRAHLLRVNSRIKAGLHDAACQDLRAILPLDPDHCHCGSEIPTGSSNFNLKTASVPQNSNHSVNKSLHLPLEIWRDIASFLSRRDLRSLVSVPHELSPIARRLLFRDIHLQFGTGKLGMENETNLPFDPGEMDKWHAQRSAEILCKLIANPAYANQVRSLSVFGPEDSGNTLFPFLLVMLANVLTKLSNLKLFKCRMDNETLTPVLGILEKNHPDLEGLVIVSTSRTPPPLPKLSRLKCLTFKSDHKDSDTIPDIQLFVATQSVALRTLVIESCLTEHPDSPLFISNLRNLSLRITIPSTYFLGQLLESGQNLECLELVVCPGRNILSTAFRSHSAPGSFPVLRQFTFGIYVEDDDEGDPDLFPAVAEVVRGRPMLETLCLSFKGSQQNPLDFGYSAAIWGVLPSLSRLRYLNVDIPEGLSPALCGYLIPRTVVVLSLGEASEVDYSELLPGLPNGLKVLETPSLDEGYIPENILPALRLVISKSAKVVYRTEHRREFRALGPRQETFYFNDWLTQLNCEDANFLYSGICDLGPWL